MNLLVANDHVRTRAAQLVTIHQPTCQDVKGVCTIKVAPFSAFADSFDKVLLHFRNHRDPMRGFGYVIQESQGNSDQSCWLSDWRAVAN